MKGLTMTVVTDDDGNTTSYEVRPFEGALEQLQAAVGGWIEAAPTSPEVSLWINEEGKLLNMPVNRLAMDVWIRYDQWRCMMAGDWLAGNAVITGGIDEDGNSLDLPEEARRWVLRVARDAGATIVKEES